MSCCQVGLGLKDGDHVWGCPIAITQQHIGLAEKALLPTASPFLCVSHSTRACRSPSRGLSSSVWLTLMLSSTFIRNCWTGASASPLAGSSCSCAPRAAAALLTRVASAAGSSSPRREAPITSVVSRRASPCSLSDCVDSRATATCSAFAETSKVRSEGL